MAKVTWGQRGPTEHDTERDMFTTTYTEGTHWLLCRKLQQQHKGLVDTVLLCQLHGFKCAIETLSVPCFCLCFVLQCHASPRFLSQGVFCLGRVCLRQDDVVFSLWRHSRILSFALCTSFYRFPHVSSVWTCWFAPFHLFRVIVFDVFKLCYYLWEAAERTCFRPVIRSNSTRTFEQPLSLEGANLLSHLHSAPWSNFPILSLFLEFHRRVWLTSYSAIRMKTQESLGSSILHYLVISCRRCFQRGSIAMSPAILFLFTCARLWHVPQVMHWIIHRHCLKLAPFSQLLHLLCLTWMLGCLVCELLRVQTLLTFIVRLILWLIL